MATYKLVDDPTCIILHGKYGYERKCSLEGHKEREIRISKRSKIERILPYCFILTQYKSTYAHKFIYMFDTTGLFHVCVKSLFQAILTCFEMWTWQTNPCRNAFSKIISAPKTSHAKLVPVTAWV